MPTATSRWRRLLVRAQKSRGLRALLLLAGIYLLALPLIFTVFAHEAGPGHHFARRVILTAVWFLCALIVGGTTTAREIGELAQRARDAIPRTRHAGERRELAALASIKALLRPGTTGLSDSFRFAAFIPDERGILVPLLEPQPQPWQRWPPGRGVVGKAWEKRQTRGSIELAVGEETTDRKLRLTAAQRRQYGHLKLVAAYAIFDENNQPVGVLSVSSDDDSDFAAAGGPAQLQLLASDIGVLVGDARPGPS